MVFSILATALVGILLYYEVRGSAVTVAWGIQALCLMLAGFGVRDRILRLSGLLVFLVCILKLFLYDLRYLGHHQPHLLVHRVGRRDGGRLVGIHAVPQPDSEVFMKGIAAAVFALLLAGGILASIGKQDRTVDLSSAREIWSDVLRDADQIGLQVTRMPIADEIQLGQELAAGIQSWEPEDPRDTQYVTAVAASLIPHLRRQGIPYRST